MGCHAQAATLFGMSLQNCIKLITFCEKENCLVCPHCIVFLCFIDMYLHIRDRMDYIRMN